MAAQNTQFAAIAISGPSPTPGRVTQLASISIQSPPTSPAQLTQYATIIVAANNRGYLQLGPVIPLNCWQPCNAYATPAVIVQLDGGIENAG